MLFPILFFLIGYTEVGEGAGVIGFVHFEGGDVVGAIQLKKILPFVETAFLQASLPRFGTDV